MCTIICVSYISPPPALTVELRLPENRYIFFFPEILPDKGNVEFEFEACDWLNTYTATGLDEVSAMFKSQKIFLRAGSTGVFKSPNVSIHTCEEHSKESCKMG